MLIKFFEITGKNLPDLIMPSKVNSEVVIEDLGREKEREVSDSLNRLRIRRFSIIFS